ncbi:PRC-barrel domain-containing protein [bacterium]|nr:PRC-barrel domain-containing protein [bacterium]
MEYYPDFMDDEEDVGGLVRLSRVRYQLADGQPDAMGWRVLDVDGLEFGAVSDLLADVGTGQIVFAAIKNFTSGTTALIPVEGMYLDLVESVVVIPVRECDVHDSPDFTDDVVDVMPFVEYWLRRIAA